jgi:UDP-N-acetylglucosamine 2-epimerase (non-hydrolysing)
MNPHTSGRVDRPIVCVVGARPNFMKMAPILRAFAAHKPQLPTLLVHTGQHYDRDMSDRLFEDLRLPQPDINLEVGSGSHAVQTAEVMRRFEPVLDEHNPRAVLVVGDVNSTRSYDRTMPEEINRLMTDQVADRLYTTERTAEANLLREGIDAERVCFVGNVMIDSLLENKAHARSAAETLAQHGLNPTWLADPRGYGLVTLHRPSNVDDAHTLSGLLQVLARIASQLPLVFVLHPRTKSKIEAFGLDGLIDPKRIAALPPQGYLEMLGLMTPATLVLTDSGGLQEETTALGVPCLTLRENTERPITVDQGTNTMVGRDANAIIGGVTDILAGRGKRGRVPEFWDGQASQRIAADLARWLATRT